MAGDPCASWSADQFFSAVVRLNLPQVNNNQETNRGAVSEIVDERTRFEMYYPPFAGAVKAGLGSIMVSAHRGPCQHAPTTRYIPGA